MSEPTYRPRRGKDGEERPPKPSYTQRVRTMMKPAPPEGGGAPDSAHAGPVPTIGGAAAHATGESTAAAAAPGAFTPASGWTLPELSLVLLATVIVSLVEGWLLKSPAVHALPMDAQLIVNGIVVVVYYLILLALVWWLAARRGRSFAESVGLRSFAAGKAILAILGYTLLLRLGTILYAVVLYVTRTRVPGSEIDITRFFGLSTTGVLVTIVVAGVFGPFVEEVVFRGVVFGGLCDLMPTWAAVVSSAALFAILHFNPYLAVPAFMVGIALALMYRNQNSLWPAVMLHAVYNLTSIISAYLLQPYLH